MERTVHFAVPTKVKEEIRGQLIMDVTEHLKQLTKKQINPEIVPYVAQKLPLELKRTDDELRNRDSQEIRRIQ